MYWQCLQSQGGIRCKARLTTTLAPNLFVVKSSNHTHACCFQKPHQSNKRKIDSTSFMPAKRAKLSPSAPPPPETPAQPPPPPPVPRTFTTRKGAIGLRVDGHSYIKKLVRKRDKTHVWICNQNKCSAQLETTSSYKILKF